MAVATDELRHRDHQGVFFFDQRLLKLLQFLLIILEVHTQVRGVRDPDCGRKISESSLKN